MSETPDPNPYGTPPPPPAPNVGYDPPVGPPVGPPYTPEDRQQYAPPYAGQPYGQPYGEVPGRIRSTGMCILLTIVTLGIYSLVWFYQTHDEMKRHTNNGLGGGLALVLAFFVGFVMPYITSSEVGAMYERAGQRPPVTGATGLWYFPGMLILVGPLVWFIQTNAALNEYWRSQGVS
jgi:hypothetical protein